MVGTVVGTPTLDRVRAGSPLSSHTTARPRSDALRSQAKPDASDRQAHLEQPDRSLTDATHKRNVTEQLQVGASGAVRVWSLEGPKFVAVVEGALVCVRLDRGVAVPFADRWASMAPTVVRGRSREQGQRTRCWSDDGEVSSVECGDFGDRETLSGRDDRGVDGAEREIAVTRNELRDPQPV